MFYYILIKSTVCYIVIVDKASTFYANVEKLMFLLKTFNRLFYPFNIFPFKKLLKLRDKLTTTIKYLMCKEEGVYNPTKENLEFPGKARDKTSDIFMSCDHIVTSQVNICQQRFFFILFCSFLRVTW